MENINENYEADKARQLNSMQDKIAAKRKAKQDALKKKQENEMAKEMIEQKKELAETERNVVRFFSMKLDVKKCRIYILDCESGTLIIRLHEKLVMF